MSSVLPLHRSAVAASGALAAPIASAVVGAIGLTRVGSPTASTLVGAALGVAVVGMAVAVAVAAAVRGARAAGVAGATASVLLGLGWLLLFVLLSFASAFPSSE